MMKNAQVALPADLYVPDTDASTAYHQLEQAGADARFKRMDLTYAVYLEELPKGKQGIQERVALRLSLDTGVKSNRVTIGDSIRVFETFRLTGDQGLGFTRDELVSVPWSRLRAVSQNKKWALEHRDEIRHVLTLPEEGENGIRAYIAASQPEGEKKEQKPSFVSRELRFTAEDAAAFDTFLRVVRNKAEGTGMTFSDNAGVARGQLVAYALSEWMQLETPVYTDDGRPLMDGEYLVTESNLRFFPEELDADSSQAAD
ncbi:hypothetical protein [Deinococcus sp. S9]|uniref:hypothetical protein n=1 Tax=Deinococcus sp. S9 TaxID=2545754 RepID=UPI00105623DE|nr:hypothetical protein [Deinococcus sp. S9]TDE87350.1 hypothetical protein E0686_02320 [Deinococcus sp. S9]